MDAKLSSNMCSYRMLGEGPPVVLINPWVMPSASWQAFGSTLAKKYKVVMFDFPNQGEAPLDLDLVDWRGYKIKFLQLLEELGLFPNDVAVCGFSSSAGFILRLAVQEGISFRAAALIAPMTVGYDIYAAAFHRFLCESFRIGGAYGFALAMSQRAFSPDFINSTPEMMDLILESISKAWQGRERALQVLLETSAPTPLFVDNTESAPLGFPVLIIEPEDDNIVPRQTLKSLAQRIGADYTSIRAGHCAPLERPYATAKLVAESLAKWFKS